MLGAASATIQPRRRCHLAALLRCLDARLRSSCACDVEDGADVSMRNSTDLAFTADSNRGRVKEHTFSGALSFLRRRYSKDLQDQ